MGAPAVSYAATRSAYRATLSCFGAAAMQANDPPTRLCAAASGPGGDTAIISGRRPTLRRPGWPSILIGALFLSRRCRRLASASSAFGATMTARRRPLAAGWQRRAANVTSGPAPARGARVLFTNQSQNSRPRTPKAKRPRMLLDKAPTRPPGPSIFPPPYS